MCCLRGNGGTRSLAFINKEILTRHIICLSVICNILPIFFFLWIFYISSNSSKHHQVILEIIGVFFIQYGPVTLLAKHYNAAAKYWKTTLD